MIRIDDLSHPQHRFKVDQNAQQYNLTGTAILNTELNLVVVEGGPKGIKAYKTLLLRRIDWNNTKHAARNQDEEEEAEASGDELDESQKVNRCFLVWEGEVKERSFKGFRIKTFPTDSLVRDYLGKMNAVNYWDAARNFDTNQFP